jgi:hypothetical protein
LANPRSSFLKTSFSFRSIIFMQISFETTRG